MSTANALDDGLATDPRICPFLRFDVGGYLAQPKPSPIEFQQCVATGTPRAQSLRQQELVCLQAAHADCPRYLRGAELGGVGAAGASSAKKSGHPPAARRLPDLPKATIAAIAILVVSAAISFGYVVERGGLEMPAAAAGASDGLAAVATDEPTDDLEEPVETDPSLFVEPTELPDATDAPTAEPTDAPTPEPTAAPTRAPGTPAPTPSSSRYKLLKPCPGVDNCYIYTAKSGDNLYSIARYFGVPLQSIYDMNAKYANGGALRKGDQIRMPPPTR